VGARLAPAALVAALLVATSAAFVVTEKLKLTRNPIVGPQVDKVFSPVCDCATDAAEITFRLRKPDRVTLDVIDSKGSVVRELARRRPQGRAAVSYVWDGRDTRGNVVPEGSYRPRVHLYDARRTIVMPNPIRVDLTPPRIVSFTVRPPVISPDGDGRADRAKIRYRVSERAVVELYVDSARAVRKLGTRPRGTIQWNGVVAGEQLPEGVYTLRLVARDVAGNLGPRSGSRTVRIRFLALGRDRVVIAPGARFAILALSQARRLEWHLGRRSGIARPGTLKLRAPLQPGRYTLRVEANGHVKRAAVVVRKAAAP
jgi:FlgD Ig-like domain